MKSRTKKVLLGLVGAFVVAAAVVVVPTVWGKPYAIDHLGMRMLVKFGVQSPEMMSSMRPLDAMGLAWYADELDDRDYEKRLEVFDMVDDELEVLRAFDRDELSDQDALTYDSLEFLMVEAAKLREFAYYDYPLNQMFGVQSGLPDFMINTHQINDEGDAEDYIARVVQFERALDQVLEGLRHRESQGLLPPRFVIDRVVTEMKGFVEPPPRENPLFVDFAKKLDALEGLSEEDRSEFEGQLEAAITDHVYPVYGRLIEYYGGLAESATDDDGIWHLPDGDRLYEILLRIMTTTDMTPDEIHALGLREVERIQAEITDILAEEGIEADTFLARMEQLEAQERFYYPDSDEGRAQILADYTGIIEEIDEGLAPMFDHRPEAPVVVEREELFKEETAPGAHYQPPPLDGSRPGRFVANLGDIKATPKYGMRTLAYHEAVPGHHYQIALSLENEELPLFRRMLPFTAYIEGWALYAEQLAAENGFQEDPFDRVGYLQAQLFRAVRLVVDTGIHRKQWTREQAIEYMRANTGMAESDVQAEIERYIVMPAQACSYMVGRHEILRIRSEAMAELGDDFDLPGFHDVVLRNGPLPLNLLERVVDDWVAGKKG
jgi:uncharacterized protein (DUF885 family)